MTTAPTTMSLRTPGALVASLPYLLGFQPADDLVAVWIKDGKILVTQRADLDLSLSVPEEFCRALADKNPDEVVLVAYGAISFEQSLSLSKAANKVAKVRDIMWVRDGRYASLMCKDLQCCPLEGRPIEIGDGAEFVAEGKAPLLSRETLVGLLKPRGTVRLKPLPKEGIESYRDDALLRFDNREPKAAELREMSRSLQDIRVRDTLLWEASQEGYNLPGLYERLCSVLRATHPDDAAPVATTTAIVAWQQGDGASANVACDYARKANPDYSLLTLIETALRAGLPPTSWSASMKELTRDDCRRGTR